MKTIAYAFAENEVPWRNPVPGRRAVTSLRGVLGRTWNRVARFFQYQTTKEGRPPSPWLALQLSMIPGGGQLYLGIPVHAAMHLGAFIAAIVLLRAFLFTLLAEVFAIVALLVVAFSMNHAFITAQEIAFGSWQEGTKRWGGLFLLMMLISIGISLTQYVAIIWIVVAIGLNATLYSFDRRLDGKPQSGAEIMIALAFFTFTFFGVWFLPEVFWHSALRLHKQTQPNMYPLFELGDRITFETVSRAWSPLGRGDIVLYDPPRWSVEIGKDEYVVNMTLNMERIIGVPGDVIEKKGSNYFLNGQPAPEEALPLVTNQIDYDFRIAVPPGKYLILFSYRAYEWLLLSSRTAPVIPPNELERVSLISEEEISHRALLRHWPPSRRMWLDVESVGAERRRLAPTMAPAALPASPPTP